MHNGLMFFLNKLENIIGKRFHLSVMHLKSKRTFVEINLGNNE